MELNIRQKLFIEEYLMNGYNGTQAYLKVYDTENPRTAEANSSELLGRAEVKAVIKKEMTKITRRNNISKDDILEKVMSILEDDTARNADKLKASEIILRAMGYNEPTKTELSGNLQNTTVKVKYKKEED